MKKILVSVAALMFAASVWAQTPEKMSYQAVVRDGSSKLITSHAVGMRVSVLQGSETGTVVYTETQTPTTNANGLVSIAIGSGIATVGKFADIEWSKGVYYIKTEIDPTGGTDYSIVGASQLLSVPYALYAKNAGVAGVKGEKGDTGAAGKDGAEGKSAYQIWIAAGNTGTEADFLTWLKGAAGKDGKDGVSAYEIWKAQAGNESKTEADYLTAVKGEKGDKGDKGADGTMSFSDLTAEQKAGLKGETGAAGKDGSNGLDGAKGADGKDGLSAYQIWKAQAGNENKTEAEFLAALKGEKGADGTMTFSDLTAEQKASLKGETGATGKDGDKGADGKDGLSAYQIWKAQAGNESKTEAEFFVAIKGEKGEKGETGATGATGAKGADGAQGAAGKDGANGSDGKTAYQVAVANGYAGTEAAWLASLKGATGATGATGAAGATGPKGADGLTTSVNGVTQVAGAITLTKAHIGLDKAENTADLAKPISTATQTALDAKANKATTLAGYGITDAVATTTTTTWDKDASNDVTTSGAQTIAGVKTFSDGIASNVIGNVTGNLTGNVKGSLNANSTVITNVAAPVATTDAVNKAYVDAANATKVDKVAGKELSTNDYTTAEKNKLAAQTTGTAAGQMQYWNGTAWVTVTAGLNGQILKYKNGVPTWSDGNIKDLVIGDAYQGGIIAYILQPADPGYVAGEIHGLIAAPSDQSTGIQWYNGSYTTTGATATAIGTGNANTNAIVTSQGAGSYAAKICYDLVLGGYSDWYLPSINELKILYANRIAIGNFTPYIYWSSSEYYHANAWNFTFGSGSTGYDGKYATYYVRAVRAF